MDYPQLILALCLGVSLSALCGFRVFVPLLAISLGVRFAGLSVNESLAWVGSDVALVCLSVATVVEILAYYIPLVDNVLDTISGPLALVAGAVVAAGMLPEMPAFAQWGLGIIAGAGSAGAVQLSTTTARGASSATTGGLGNFVVATAENGASILGSLVAIIVSPIIVLIGVGLLVWLVWRLLRKLRPKYPAAKTA